MQKRGRREARPAARASPARQLDIDAMLYMMMLLALRWMSSRHCCAEEEVKGADDRKVKISSASTSSWWRAESEIARVCLSALLVSSGPFQPFPHFIILARHGSVLLLSPIPRSTQYTPLRLILIWGRTRSHPPTLSLRHRRPHRPRCRVPLHESRLQRRSAASRRVSYPRGRSCSTCCRCDLRAAGRSAG